MGLWPEGVPFNKSWTPDEAIADALAKHPDCTYADWGNGLDCLFNFTIVVSLWRNEECFLEGDPAKYKEEGYYR